MIQTFVLLLKDKGGGLGGGRTTTPAQVYLH